VKGAGLSERMGPRGATIGLLVAYLGFAILYGWQAWRRVTPTVFTDELEFTQLSRAISETGSPARRGVSFPAGLYEYLVAPVWWLDSISDSYGVIKLVGVALMTATIFPAYGLARLAVSRPFALFAAILTVAAPALVYAPFLVSEPAAYPASALALLLIARWVMRPTWLRFGLAVGGCALGLAVRTQLAVHFAVLFLGLLAVGWRTERMRRYRATWTRWDWAGAVTLAFGCVLAFFAFMGHRSESWYVSTGFEKEKMFDYGLWAAGALGIGIGLLPFVAGLAALVTPKGEALTPGRRAFVVTAVSAIAAVSFYSAVKATFASIKWSTIVAERNMIYLVPILATGTALLLERRRARWWAIVAAALFALYLIRATPLKIDLYPYYEAHGLAIAALANRIFIWDANTIVTALTVVLALATVLLLVVASPRWRRAAPVLAGIAVAFTVGWSLTTQVYGAESERDLANRLAGNIPKPADWLDRATGGGSTVFVGQHLSDPTAVWLMEFWNRSIDKVWSIDGSAPGPGPILTPDLKKASGVLTPSPETDWAVTANGVVLQGKQTFSIGNTYVYKLDGPLKVRYAQDGVYSDGWMGDKSSYSRYDAAELGPSLAKVTLSRSAWCSDKDVPGTVTVRIGPTAVIDKQPGIARVTDERRFVIRACEVRPVVFRTPHQPWRIEVKISPTFVPAEVDPTQSDRRELGALVGYEVIPLAAETR
jgi:hypothetical protein